MADAEGEFQAGEELDGTLEGGFQGGSAGTDDVADAQAELEAMKARLAQMEAEASKLREAQAKAGEQGELAGGSEAGDGGSREEADNRSVYVGQVDYGATPEELQLHFAGCGTVNRVTILTDKLGNAKGYAYIEFLEADAVANALLLDGSELRGRALKVLPKRTNVPGLRVRGRGRGRGGFRGGGGFRGRGYGGYPYGGGYGYAPRGRRGRFYSPY